MCIRNYRSLNPSNLKKHTDQNYKGKKVLFILPYPLRRAPSQRFRIEAFFPLLEEGAFYFETDTFLSTIAWSVLYKKGSGVQKMFSVIKGFLKRCFTVLFKAPRFDFIVIHREASPIGPPVFEWILSRIFRKKIIFDFDDAIWIPNITENNSIASVAKCFWKIKYICKWSYRISAGNQFLSDYASKFNKNVQVIPTCVDTVKRYNRLKDQHSDKIVIGWTGSHSTMPYLEMILPVIKKLEDKYNFEFLIICDRKPDFQLKSLRFLPWNEQTEIDDLVQFNIGIMPLKQDLWSEGKCGFKIIQYLSLGIPAVASPVGVNKQIINNGVNGFLCSSDEEWYQSLASLLENEQERNKMGKVGKAKIEESYSIQSNSNNFISLFS